MANNTCRSDPFRTLRSRVFFDLGTAGPGTVFVDILEMQRRAVPGRTLETVEPVRVSARTRIYVLLRAQERG